MTDTFLAVTALFNNACETANQIVRDNPDPAALELLSDVAQMLLHSMITRGFAETDTVNILKSVYIDCESVSSVAKRYGVSEYMVNTLLKQYDEDRKKGTAFSRMDDAASEIGLLIAQGKSRHEVEILTGAKPHHQVILQTLYEKR